MMTSPRNTTEETVGADIFIDSALPPEAIAAIVQDACVPPLNVTMISNRGTQVWPTGSVYTDHVNHHRVRVESAAAVDPGLVLQIVSRVSQQARVCSLEMLLRLDGQAAYSLAQGQ